ncbi:hypothetical protein L209DRAFT_747227 [Thermothelomyces heterothallicus CBS 203.75]
MLFFPLPALFLSQLSPPLAALETSRNGSPAGLAAKRKGVIALQAPASALFGITKRPGRHCAFAAEAVDFEIPAAFVDSVHKLLYLPI